MIFEEGPYHLIMIWLFLFVFNIDFVGERESISIR